MLSCHLDHTPIARSDIAFDTGSEEYGAVWTVCLDEKNSFITWLVFGFVYKEFESIVAKLFSVVARAYNTEDNCSFDLNSLGVGECNCEAILSCFACL